ncbi:MAG: hypothetical protein FWF88_13045, partial [Peptococcaceae bacterium]|nr:hypothetical protein [Peptococcaceae bacterium]
MVKYVKILMWIRPQPEGQEGAVGHRAEPFREWRQRVLGLGAEKSAGCLICAFRVKALDPAP